MVETLNIEQSKENTSEILQQITESDDGSAMYEIALQYEVGDGVEQSFEKAVEYYEKAIESGHTNAMFNLAISYRRGEGVEQSFEKAVEYYQMASDLGHADAMFSMAVRHERGEGVEKSLEKAFEYYQKASDLGHMDSMHNLAIHYEYGEGVEKSFEKAIEYYEKAVELGHREAMFNLAICYRRGDGVKQSFKKAVEYFEKAADLGHSDAMFSMAIRYERGEGVEQSFEKAVEYYEKAAELNHSSSIHNLAVSYHNGEGVVPSLKKAMEYYEKAAELGHSSAIHHIGVIYLGGEDGEDGEGVEQSFEKAIEYFQKAAELDHSDSIFNLALMHERGEGVEQSYEKAVEYYQKGVELDDRKSMFNLAVHIRRGNGCEQSQTQAEQLFQQLYEMGDNDALRYMPHPSLKKYVYRALAKEGAIEDKGEVVKRAFAQFQDAIINVMESCEYKEEKAIYHFTRWPAIESILPKEPTKNDKNVIRLYHEDYMNDPSEGMSLDMIIESGVLDSEYHGVANFMGEALNLRSSLTEDASTYLASFTKLSDRLDLWRAYGADGDGFCLKIDIDKTDRHIWSQAKLDIDSDEQQEDTHLYKLYNIQYKEDEKREKLESLLTALKPLYEISNKLPDEVQSEIKKTIFYMLGEVVYLFKDEQYSSEKEVRMFQRLSLNEVCVDESDIGKLYKATGAILFTGKNSEIIIGPKVDKPRVVELSLRKRLQVNGFDKTKVSHSKVKYR